MKCERIKIWLKCIEIHETVITEVKYNSNKITMQQCSNTISFNIPLGLSHGAGFKT